MSNRGKVIINGNQSNVIGRVCMDQFMVDATNVKGLKPYDEAVIIGDGQTANELAKSLNTIPYEIVCAIKERVYRIYVK